MRRRTAWSLMAVHVAMAAVTYVLAGRAAVGFPGPRSLTLLRAGLAAVLFLPLFGWWIPVPRFRPHEWAWAAALGLILVVGNQFLFLKGMRHTAPNHPALLFATTPLVVLLLSALLRRAWPPRRKGAGVVLALAGTVLLLRPWQADPAARELQRGDLAILGAVLAWALYTVAAGPLCRRHDPLTVTSVSLILGAVLFAPFHWSALREVDPAAIPASAWIGLAWLAAATSVVMMLIWNVLLRHLEPVEVAICSNAQPPATAALVAVLAGLDWYDGHTDLGPLYWLGMLLVLGGIALVQWRPRTLVTASEPAQLPT